jgi:hypothetical protein
VWRQQDSRFSQAVDLKNGYRTRNILTLPIRGQDSSTVGGVIQVCCPLPAAVCCVLCAVYCVCCLLLCAVCCVLRVLPAAVCCCLLLADVYMCVLAAACCACPAPSFVRYALCTVRCMLC